jgi:Mg-chelatase subunit ChlD
MGTISADYQASGPPLAWSPIMLAAPSRITGQFTDGEKTTWSRVISAMTDGSVPAGTMPDPQRSTVGLLAVLAVNAAMARTNPDEGIAQLRALTLRSRIRDATADSAALLRKLGGEWNVSRAVRDVGLFPITEQQLRDYQRGEHTVELGGAYPSDGLVEADYPYAVAKSTEQRELAGRLRAAIGRTALAEAGFRSAPTPGAVKVPGTPAALLEPARTWAAYRTLTTQVLLLIDSSGSMNDEITGPGGKATTRAALLRESGRAAAQLFSDDTSVGLWLFGSPTQASPAHTQAVSFGPITDKIGTKPRREVLTAAMAGYRAPAVAGTPLYQSVLDATAAMKAEVKRGTVTLVVVLSDGVDGESRFAMPRAEFLQKLTAQRDPARPVPVIAVGYGPDADMSALTAMASATGGEAIAATDPADLAAAMAKAFLAAHAPR